MFTNCENLISINFTSHIKTDNISTFQNMFRNCISLVSIDLSNLNTSKVNNVSGMFSGCTKLKTVIIGKLNLQKVTNMNYLFYNCQLLEYIDIKGLQNTYKLKYMYEMFGYCRSLKEIDFSSFDMTCVEDIRYMFYQCDSLTYVNFSNHPRNKLKWMCFLFY